MKIRRFFLVIAFLFPHLSSAQTIDAVGSTQTDAERWFQTIKSCRIAFSSPVTSLKLARDAGIFEFNSGRIDILEPVRGRYHAAIFEGQGIFRLAPPTRIEKDQLIKFTKSERIDEEFDCAVLRFTDNTAAEIMASLGIDSIPENQEGGLSIRCQENMEKIMKEYLRNIDSRVLCDIASEESGYFFADIDSRTKGKFIFEIDPHSREEVTLSQFQKAPAEFIDTWCSFHLADQYRGEKAVYDESVETIEIPYFELDVTLEKDGKFTAAASLDCVAIEKPVAAIPLIISRLVEVDEVVDDQGRSCFFVHEEARDKAGEPPLRQEKLVVCLPVPLLKGENRRLTIRYHSNELIKKGHGAYLYDIYDTAGWYPKCQGSGRSKCKITYRFPPELELVSVGEKKKEWREADKKCSMWEQDIPVSGICFNFGTLKHYRIAAKDLPPVDVYAGGYQTSKKRMHNAGADVANSLGFFQGILTRYPFPGIIVTEMPTLYGQGFPGFLILSHYSFNDDIYAGINEAFRAHEVAHQWWGHVVGWETYHDQWLSEGFAEFFGALFAHLSLAEKKKNLFQEIAKNWRNDILNQGNLAFVRYGYPKLNKQLTMGSKSGPLWLGPRLSSSKSPIDYQILVYEKGAYVLHMLLMIMRDLDTNSDDRFLAMMKDFISTHAWRDATTEGFQRIVEKHIGIDMSWFFDQWVYGTDIPTYRFKWSAEPGDEGKWSLVMEIQQSDVPEGFKMPVLVLVDFGKGRYSTLRCPVDKPTNVFRIRVPEKPRNVDFNFCGSVLCREK